MGMRARYIHPGFLDACDGLPKSMMYTGTSMNPALKASDVLQVLPYRREKIQPGDVIVFLPPGSSHVVVHRVISVNAQAIRTRGDHNRDIDSWVVSSDCVVGRVVWAQRGNRRRSIHGGLRGRLYSFGIRPIRMIDLKISSLLHPIYRRLAQTGVLRPWLPVRMETRVLSFDRSAGTELQLVMGRRIIGRLLPGRNEWLIRRPFRLFVNEASLPRGDRGVRS